MRKIPTPQDIQQRLEIVHQSMISLREETYVNTKVKCVFVDVDLGEFEAIPNNVLRGSGHPKKAKELRRKTCQEKYGVDYNWQASEVKAKAVQTFLTNYGVKNPFQSEKIKQKSKSTLMKHYGVDNPRKSVEINARIEATNIERYGAKCSLSNFDVQQKVRLTNIAKYGVENPMQNHEILVKALRSGKKLYLVKHWKTEQELACAAKYEFAFVNWCNTNQIDFDWQIPHKMPNGLTYVIDAYIKSGELEGQWVEIKGWFRTVKNQAKWDWFHLEHPNNSQLWNLNVLTDKGILVNGKPNSRFM
ncbi:MAG TPA: hypothetical protein VIJ14_06245 [Rhabdochlamydiaceae bacterium]